MKSEKKVKTIGIIGYGQFGSFIHILLKSFFGPELSVTWCDSKDFKRRNAKLTDVVTADIVFVAVPLSVYAETIKVIAPLLGKDSIVVDVATVKKHTVEACKKYLKNKYYICTHPMFGPKSYQKTNETVDGFRIVITDSTLPKSMLKKVEKFLQQKGFKIIHLSADEHDKYLAETLFVTHYVGQMVSRSGFVRTTIDTVSFGFLMDAVDSVKDDEQLFSDVYRLNPYCKKVVKKMEKSSQLLFLK